MVKFVLRRLKMTYKFKWDFWNLQKYKENAIYFYTKWDEVTAKVSLLEADNEMLRNKLERYKRGQFKKGCTPWNKKKK